MYLLHHLLTDTAARIPEKGALVFKGRVVSYGELERDSNALAALLRAHGVARGDRVGILLNKSVESVTALFGILKAGGVYVPLDPTAPGTRLRSIMRHCGMRTAVASQEQLERVQPAGTESVPLEKAVVLSAPDAAASARDCIIDAVRWNPGSGAAPSPESEGSGAAPAYILHTSGSTGTPKGVVISHLNALTFVEMATEFFRIGESDRVANHAPLHFDLSVFDIFCSVKAGATLVIVPEALSAFPVRLAELMADERITVWNSVASVLTKLAEQGAIRRLVLPELRLVHFSGDIMPVRYLRVLRGFMPNADFYNIYGQTEANSSLFFKVPEEVPDDAWKIPIGRPFPNFDVFAVDEKGDVVDAPGREGELHVLSATVALGYWNDPGRTGAQFTADPRTPSSHARVYRTGDLARVDADGNYVFAGRRDHMVKSKGFRVELDEIEIVLSSHPGVRQAAVVALPDDLAGSRIIACLCLADGAAVDPSELLSLCCSRLPKYMVPERIVYRPSLPTTSNGKIDRNAVVLECREQGKP